MESKFDLKTHEILATARVKMLENIYDCHSPQNKKFDCPPLKRLAAKGIYKENGK